MKRPAVALAAVATLGAGLWYLTRQPEQAASVNTPSPLNFIRGLISMTPGIRNNNPFNMRDYNIPWLGRVGADKAGLLIFDKVENGIRAAGNDLKNGWLKGETTISKIVSAWAPPKGKAQDGTEYTNPTEKYIQFVSQQTGIAPNKELSSFGEYVAIGKAMIKMENGKNPYDDALIAKSLRVGMTYGQPLPFYFDWSAYA